MIIRTPWYHGWNVLAVGMVFQAITFGIGIYCFTFWVAPWADEFNVGRGRIMTVFLTMQIMMGLVSPFAGRAMDHRSIRLIISAGAAALALALVLAGRATDLWQLNLLWGTLVVAGTVLAGPLAAQTLAAKWFDRRRGLALGVCTIGTSIGGFGMPPLLTYLQSEFGWRVANDYLAILVVVAIIPLVLLLVRNSPAAAGITGEGAAFDNATPPTAEQATPEINSGEPWRTSELFQSRAFWMTVIAFTPMATAFGGAQQNLAPYTLDNGIDAQATAYLVSIMALSMIAAKVFFGAMSDRWDHRWLFLLAVAILAVTLVMLRTTGTSTGAGVASYQKLLLICSLLGIAAGSFLPLTAAVVSSRFGAASFGQVMGLLGPFTTLAAVGPWIAAHLRDTTGSYDDAWMVFLLLLIPAAIAIVFVTPGPVQRRIVAQT